MRIVFNQEEKEFFAAGRKLASSSFDSLQKLGKESMEKATRAAYLARAAYELRRKFKTDQELESAGLAGQLSYLLNHSPGSNEVRNRLAYEWMKLKDGTAVRSRELVAILRKIKKPVS